MSTGNQPKTERAAEPSRTADASNSSSSEIFAKLRSKVRGENWLENGFDLAIILVIVSLALFIRIVLAYEFRVRWGNGSGNIWNYSMPFNINDVYIEGFADFKFYYYSWITGWYEEGWYLYEWADPIDQMDFYSYPPVFMYFLVFTWRPGLSNFWMAFPMILSDAACAGVVYMILKNVLSGEKSRPIAIVGGVFMALAPINIIYDGIWWLNPGPVTFFTLLAFYFATKKKWWQSFAWLAVATMTKQNALFFTYPVFMAMLGEKVREKSIKETIVEGLGIIALYLGVVLVLSMPWIVISPYQYGRHMLFPGKPISTSIIIDDPPINQCVSFARSIQELGLSGFLLNIIAFGNNSMFWMVLGASIISVLMLWRSYKGNLDKVEFYEWIAIYTIISHIFMPRGVYKFYTAYYVPMILIAVLGQFVKMLSEKEVLIVGILIGGGIFFGFNIWLLTINRLLVPFLLFMTAVTIGVIGSIRWYIRRNKQNKESKQKIQKFLESPIGS